MYRREYGVIPTGDATAVARVVFALNTDDQNPKKLDFASVSIDHLRFDKHGTWVDDWGNPILLLRINQTNAILRSYGKNRRDDGGSNDDISVRAIWENEEK